MLLSSLKEEIQFKKWHTEFQGFILCRMHVRVRKHSRSFCAYVGVDDDGVVCVGVKVGTTHLLAPNCRTASNHPPSTRPTLNKNMHALNLMPTINMEDICRDTF